MTRQTKGHPLREARRSEAQKRAAARVERTASQQIERLDRDLGAGVGATAERARLAAS